MGEGAKQKELRAKGWIPNSGKGKDQKWTNAGFPTEAKWKKHSTGEAIEAQRKWEKFLRDQFGKRKTKDDDL